MKADAATEKAVMKILENLSDGLASRHVQRVLGLFATDADIVLLGSEEGEKAIGRRELENFLGRIFSRPMALSFEWRWHLVSIEGSVAWAVTEGLVHRRSADQHLSSPYRATIVLKEKNGSSCIATARSQLLHTNEPN